jgi:predicted nucleotidyltransferase
MAAEPNQPTPPLSDDELLHVCRLLQQHKVKYVLVGGCACGLHGLVRSTQDIDLLVEPSPENLQRVLDALAELPDGAARELTVKDLEENVVVKVADAIMVDVAKQAWTLSYEEAIRDAPTLDVEGVRIVYASLDALIKSKSTYREQDRVDRERLIWLKQEKQKN